MNIEPTNPSAGQFRRALRECGRWGVSVKLPANLPHSLLEREGYVSPAPYHCAYIAVDLGANGRSLGIVWREDDAHARNAAAALLHEMAHVIVGVHPATVNEQEAMLAVEHEAGRRLKIPRSDFMHEFRLLPFTSSRLWSGGKWSKLSTCTRAEALRVARDDAVAKGLLDDKGRPTYRRRIL